MEAEPDCLQILIDDPVGDTVHQPYSAFCQGFDARELGLDADLNPYPKGIENEWWNDGWKTSDEQDGGEPTPVGSSGDHPQAVGGWRKWPDRPTANSSRTKS